MTTQNQPHSLMQRARGISVNKATAVCIWLLGAWLTAQALTQLGTPDPMNYIAGILIQWGLTKAESPLWRGRGYHPIAVGATIVDAAVNSAGAWPYVKNLGRTDFWGMVRDVAQAQAIQPNLFTLVAFTLSIGLAVAGAAEYFWNLPD